MLKRFCRMIVFAAATFFSSPLVQAGYHAPLGIFIYADSFNGSLGAVRASADNTSYIGCQLVAMVGSAYGHCFAQNSSKLFKECYFSDPGMIQTVGSMTITSYILVYFDDTGHCTSVAIDTDSSSPPMVP
jgi:hypothetical protein